MQLNGWQRLRIVSLVVWTLVVQALAYSAWPTTDSIRPDEVYAHMPRSTKWALRDAGEPLFRPTRDVRPTRDSILVDIDGHSVPFMAGVPDDQMTTTKNAYSAALRETLRTKRNREAQWWFAIWAVPAGALSLGGWAVGWVRRGFTTSQPG